YYPEKQLTIKRSFITVLGRHIHELYDDDYCKHGLIIYMLTEVNGLILKMNTRLCLLEDETNINHEEIVYKLLSGFEGRGHVIYLNEYYTSYSLVKNLLKKKIHTTGRLKRENTEYFPAVVRATLKQGEFFHQLTNEGICVMRYQDIDKKYADFMISSECSTTMKETGSKRRSVKKPEIVVNYFSLINAIKLINF
ncbi:hypothetical protein WN51_10129, partial [Melipona quadrifasciata]